MNLNNLVFATAGVGLIFLALYQIFYWSLCICQTPRKHWTEAKSSKHIVLNQLINH